jgi:hypothetical protein
MALEDYHFEEITLAKNINHILLFKFIVGYGRGF